MASKEFTARFEIEKETKNTIRYSETPEEGQPARIGTLYVQKWAVNGARALTVTVRVE